MGVCAGIIDVLPMLARGLSWDANVSSALFVGRFRISIASSGLTISGPLKGVLISTLVLIPCAVLIGWNAPYALIPVSAMTLVLGCLLGYFIEKYGE